jgi:hypothetical protein
VQGRKNLDRQVAKGTLPPEQASVTAGLLGKKSGRGFHVYR